MENINEKEKIIIELLCEQLKKEEDEMKIMSSNTDYIEWLKKIYFR